METNGKPWGLMGVDGIFDGIEWDNLEDSGAGIGQVWGLYE